MTCKDMASYLRDIINYNLSRILSGIQFTMQIIEILVVETKRFVGSFVNVNADSQWNPVYGDIINYNLQTLETS